MTSHFVGFIWKLTYTALFTILILLHIDIYQNRRSVQTLILLYCLPAAKYTDYKTSWPPEPIGHKSSWKASRGSSQTQLSRPPPGLPSQKQSSPSPWSGGAPRLAGRSWSSGSGTTGKCPNAFFMMTLVTSLSQCLVQAQHLLKNSANLNVHRR